MTRFRNEGMKESQISIRTSVHSHSWLLPAVQIINWQPTVNTRGTSGWFEQLWPAKYLLLSNEVQSYIDLTEMCPLRYFWLRATENLTHTSLKPMPQSYERSPGGCWTAHPHSAFAVHLLTRGPGPQASHQTLHVLLFPANILSLLMAKSNAQPMEG